MKLLFICNQGMHRSRTAEFLFKKQFETRSRGLFNDEPIKESDLEWADLIFVMEDFQRKELSQRFPKTYLKKQILSLNISDNFYFNQPELITELQRKVNEAMLATH